MNLRRLLTGIALRQIEVLALTQTSVHLTMYECKYLYDHKPPENFYVNNHRG